MKNEKYTEITNFRPSSPRSVAVRGIGAAHTLYPAISRTKTLRDDVSGMTQCVARGFTLIELLVVVLIIGILAAVAVPQYQKAVAKARSAEIITTLSAVDKAIDIYMLANGVKPGATVDDLDLSINWSATGQLTPALTCDDVDQECVLTMGSIGNNPIEFDLYSTHYLNGGSTTHRCTWYNTNGQTLCNYIKQHFPDTTIDQYTE